MSLVNIGKRPINITMVAGKNSDSSFFIKPDNLPRILKEAESHIEIYPIDNLDKMISCALVELYACDANGKNWSVNAEDIAAINVKFKKYCSEGR